MCSIHRLCSLGTVLKSLQRYILIHTEPMRTQSQCTRDGWQITHMCRYECAVLKVFTCTAAAFEHVLHCFSTAAVPEPLKVPCCYAILCSYSQVWQCFLIQAMKAQCLTSSKLPTLYQRFSLLTTTHHGHMCTWPYSNCKPVRFAIATARCMLILIA